MVVESALFSPLLLVGFPTVQLFDSGNLDKNVLLYFCQNSYKNSFNMTMRSSNRQLDVLRALSFRELIVGFLEMETPASASSTLSQLSTDLIDVWPHRRRPVLTPVTLFSAPVGVALVGFEIKIQGREKNVV